MAQRDTPSDDKARPNPERPRAEPSGSSTPSTDLQPEDAGTAASGAASSRGTAAEPAMKQFAKTEAESGSGGGRG